MILDCERSILKLGDSRRKEWGSLLQVWFQHDEGVRGEVIGGKDSTAVTWEDGGAGGDLDKPLLGPRVHCVQGQEGGEDWRVQWSPICMVPFDILQYTSFSPWKIVPARMSTPCRETTRPEKWRVREPLVEVVWTSPSTGSCDSPSTCTALWPVLWTTKLRSWHIFKVIMLAVAPVSSTRYTVRERLEQARMRLSVILTLWILTTLHGETLVRPVFAWMSVAS